MKRPSKKDVEELERLIASKCDSSDPDSPPVWRVCLQSSPLSWSPLDVASYIQGKEDVTHLAHLFVNEEVDGEAFLLLNLPTLLDHWNLRITEAITLCRHIESVKLAFYNQFAFDNNGLEDYSN